MKENIKRAIFFDLDGTLWDALPSLKEAYNIAMEKAGQPYRFDLKQIKSYMGLTPEETCLLAFKDKTIEEGLALFKLCYDYELVYLQDHPGTLYPHVKEVLGQLKKDYHLYIVSNADKGYIENFIASCHMEEYFEGFIQAGDTSLPKWKNILYLKEREHVDDLIYVGDTLKDKEETQKAQQKFIHAAYGFGQIEDDEYFVSSFDELPSLVKKLFSI